MGFIFGGGKSTTTRADKIGDFQINSASYGEVVPDILGTTRVSGNVIYWDDFTAHEHRQTQRTGKGGGSKHTSITYTYTVAAALALCEGPISGVGKVWVDKEIYDYPHPSIQLSLFRGTAGQAPWPYVQGKHPEKALPYSGLAYMAGVVDLGDRGSLPNYNFEVRGKLLNTGDGVDVNPADYILHVLKSAGMSDVQIDGLDNYRKYCAAADLLISSPPSMSAEKAQSIINDIADMTNAYLFWSNNKLKIEPLADEAIGGWSPDKQIKYDLTHDDLIPGSDGQLVLYSRKDSSECYNQASVEFINRANSYEKEVVSFEVVADVQRNGLRPASVKQAHYLYTKKRAMYLAEQLAMKQLYAKNQYTFRLDWAFCRLEPGDLVTLTDDICQLNKQVVVITAVNEANDGQLEITAVGKPPGTYAPAKYDVHENERPFVDYNQSAPSIINLSIIQAPGDIAGDELLLGVTAPNGWGGCNVWVSDSGDAYKQVGTINQKARMGKLVSVLTSTGTTCTVKMEHGELKSGTHLDAERGNTVCWLNGECLSYETATLQSNGTYVLAGLVRGQYGTSALSHSAGAEIVRIDEALFRAPYRSEDIGKKIYIKCTSMNIFGGQEQDLADVQVYTHVIGSYYIPEVSNLTLYTKYYDLGRGIKSYDVIATYTPPNISSFDTAEGWYREGNGDWKYGGTGNGQVVISGCELGKTYDVRIQVKDIHGNYSQGVTKSIQVVMKSEKPNTPQGFSVAFSDRAYFNWLEVRNADVDYYEVRSDMNPGEVDGLIGRSNNTTFSTDALTNRKGKIYLYAHNPVKGYSAPAIVEYNVPKPQQPQFVQAKAKLNGISIAFSAIPSSCKGANIYIDDEVHFVTANSTFIALEGGVYGVRVAYVDMFGEGEQTVEQLVTVELKIDAKYIDQEALGLVKIKTAINDIDNKVSQVSETGSNQYQAINNRITNIDNRVGLVSLETEQALNSLDSRIATSAKKIVSSEAGAINSRITQLDNAVDSRIDNKIANVNSRITQLDNMINATVANTKAGLQSQITQQAGLIDTAIKQVKATIIDATKPIDLNNYMDDGLYVVYQNIQVPNVQHRPDDLGNAFYLKVYSGVYKAQDITEFHGNTSWHRYYNEYGWTDWIKSSNDLGVKSMIETRVTQSADSITASVDNKLNEVNSRITLLDDTINATVANTKEGLQSQITQQAGLIDTAIKQVIATIIDATKPIDLNNYMDDGLYVVYQNIQVPNVQHRPDDLGNAFYLKVYSGVYKAQDITEFHGNTSWHRHYNENGWTGWIKSSNDLGVKSMIETRVTQSADSITASVDNKIANVNSRITLLDNTINTTVTNKVAQIASRFTQLSDSINFRIDSKVGKNEILSQINLSQETIKIAGKYIKIDGTTEFTNGVIVGRMLAAKSITADKLAINSLDAIVARIGLLRTKTSGARVEISDNLIQVFDDNNRLRVRMGIW